MLRIWSSEALLLTPLPDPFDLFDFLTFFYVLGLGFGNKESFENHLEHVRVGVGVDYWLKNLIKYQPFDQTQNDLSLSP